MNTSRRQVMRFAMIGLVSTAIYFGLLVGLRSLVPSVIILTAMCYSVAMGFNFLAQGMFTFEVRRLSGGQMGRYLVMHGGNLTANSLAMAALVDGLDIHILVAQVFVTGSITIATYALSKAWVYK